MGGDVTGGLDVSVADEVFGRPGALPGYTEALWFNGGYSAQGTNTITVGGACPSFHVEGDLTAAGTSTLNITLDDVDPLDYNDGVFFGGDVAGSVNITLRDLHGTVDEGGPVDVTFAGEVYTYQGDTLNLSIGDADTHAADELLFVGNVWQNDNGASVNISGYANYVEAFGFFQPATYSVEAESAYFHYDFGKPDRHVQAGDDPMLLIIRGDAYIDYDGSSIHLVQGLDTGNDLVYGSLDDSIVYPWPGNGVVAGSFQSTGDVVVHALGYVLADDYSGGISAGGDVFVTSLFGQIGRTDQTFQASDDISVVDWFGPIAADLDAGGTIQQVVAGTLPGGGPVDFGYWDGGGLWNVDWGMGFAYWTDGDDEVGTADDDFSWVNNSAVGRILQLDADGNGILGKYWDSNLGTWLQDDTFGWAGWWDHDAAADRTDWNAGSIAGISGSEEVRAIIDSSGDIGVHYNGTSSDGTDYSQDDIYQGIVSLHTISGKISAGGDIVLVHAANLVRAMNRIDDLRARGGMGGTYAAGNDIDSIIAGSLDGALISAGFTPGADGQLGTGDDAVLFFQDIVRVNSDGAAGITGTSFQATDDIWTLLSDGALGTAGTSLFAGDDVGTLRSVADMGFDTIRAGDISGTGVIDFIRVNESNDFGGPDPTLISDVFATLRVNRIDVEAAALGGTVWASVLDLNLDTDNDGA